MDVTLGRAFCFLAVLVTAAAASAAADPSAKSAADKAAAAEYSDPKATYRTFIEAVRKNDVKAAKRCWVIDDDNKSGALDTIVGIWISM